MREHPILFSGPMIRAIREGRKTQTRRVVRPQPPEDGGKITVDRYHPTVIDRRGDEQPGTEIFGAFNLDGSWGAKCRFGEPGDRLYVRETFSYVHGQRAPQIDSGLPVHYWADGDPIDGDWTRPKPSIHMPRWASRLTLTLTDVRVERVQDISEDDARAEGVDAVSVADVPRQATLRRRDDFRHLWDSINASRGYSWESNCFVWCLTFAPADAPGGTDG